MKTGLVTLQLLTITMFLVLSSHADSTVARTGPDYFQDTCSARISSGARCQPSKCAADCTRQFRGGVGSCDRSGCMCVYTCPAVSPLAMNESIA
ncbi:defensin-like protein 124 [Zea mays]|uniref:Uncharacterized protein n=1 Tax=Zea mays TaxID=4577 RepID=A0A1D6HLV2_MAIZE|nr:defensin-like protein 124 [Zea mays]AQK75360.1 hypothetical protein ZEAMMB73_Zm00001d018254 [Zea mays]|eukprot:XP_008646345.1 defensin-like protein 124 [Zea mays]